MNNATKLCWKSKGILKTQRFSQRRIGERKVCMGHPFGIWQPKKLFGRPRFSDILYLYPRQKMRSLYKLLRINLLNIFE